MAYNIRRRSSRTKLSIHRPMTTAAISQDRSFGSRQLSNTSSTKEILDRCKSAPDKYRLTKTPSPVCKTPIRISRKAGWCEKSQETSHSSPISPLTGTSGFDTFDEDYDFDRWSEDEETDTGSDYTKVYEESCRSLQIVPIDSFCRQMASEGTDVVLRNKLLNPTDLKAVAISLVNNVVVQTLDLSGNNIGPLGTSYISQVLKENTFLSEINLSSTNPGIEGLKLLCHVIKDSRSIRVLNLSGNQFDIGHAPFLATIISTNDYLQRLDLSYNKIGDDGGQIIGPAIGENVSLQELDLKWNHLRMKGATAVANGIEVNLRLEKVDISWNGFGREGCKAMATTLTNNQTITELNMACNRIDIKSLELLLDGVVQNESLQRLGLGLNPITTDGAMILLDRLKDSSKCCIQELDISDVPVDDRFQNLLLEIQSVRPLAVVHGKRSRVTDIRQPEDKNNFQNYDPLMILYQYMKEDNLRLIDVFKSFDVNHDNSITRQEFRDGFLSVNIPITEHGLDVLVKKLDFSGDGKVDFTELGEGHRKIRRKVSSLMHKLRENKLPTHMDNMEPNGDAEPFSKLQGLVKDAVSTKRTSRLAKRNGTSASGHARQDKQKLTVPNMALVSEISEDVFTENDENNLYPDTVKMDEQPGETEDDLIELANHLRQLFQAQKAGTTLRVVFKATAAFNQMNHVK